MKKRARTRVPPLPDRSAGPGRHDKEFEGAMPFHSCARWCVAGLLAAGLLGTVGLAAAEGPAQELPKAPEAPAETAPEPRPADNGAPSRALVGTILHGPEQPIDLGSA